MREVNVPHSVSLQILQGIREEHLILLADGGEDLQTDPLVFTAQVDRHQCDGCFRPVPVQNRVQALIGGKVDAVVIDNNPAKEFVKSNKGLKLLDTAYAEEDYAIGINKDSKDLYEAVNGALKELKEDGTVDKIVDKYIKAE